MAKFVALQPIVHNGRLHQPGETIDCPDHNLARRWIENGAVSAPAEIDAPQTEETPTEDAVTPPKDAPPVQAATSGQEQAAAEPPAEQPTAGQESTSEDSAPTEAEASKPKLGRAGKANG